MYKSQRRGGRGVTGMKQREEDFVSELMISSSHSHILFISNLGTMYKLKCYELPEGSKNARGTNIVNLLPLNAGENRRSTHYAGLQRGQVCGHDHP